MYLFLLLAGLLAIAVGLVTIGLGLPIDVLNLGSFGNALSVAGTVLLTGGLLLIGLAAVLRQLQRMAAGLAVQSAKPAARPVEKPEPVAPSTARPATPPQAAVSPARPSEIAASRSPDSSTPALTPRLTPTPRPRASELRASETHPPEPRLAETRVPEPRAPEPAPPPEPRAPLRWLRDKPADTVDEPQTADAADEPTPSPRPRYAKPSEPDEPKVWSPARHDVPAPSDATPGRHVERDDQAPPAGDRPKDTGLFDVSWPNPRSAPADTVKRETQEPAPALRHRDDIPADRRPAAAAPTPERTAPAILKSGVIDGMAYTLYADGSIEAELPQGTLTFASVDELRIHLEQHGG